MWGENVNYTLMGQFEAFNPDSDTIYLNFVTTLVCVYLDHNSDKSLAEATNAVKVFLDIPAEVDIGEGLYPNNKYFSPVKFRERSRNGRRSRRLHGKRSWMKLFRVPWKRTPSLLLRC